MHWLSMDGSKGSCYRYSLLTLPDEARLLPRSE
jgi:hypothetical protein